MSAASMRTFFDKIPVLMIAVAFLGFTAFQHWQFLNSPDSDLNQRIAQVQSMEKEIAKAKERKRQAEQFYRTLEQKRAEVRLLASQLQNMRATLSDDVDVGGFLKTVITEAKKVGLKVLSFRPSTTETKNEYYAETQFLLRFQGLFVQALVFLNRISELDRIVRVENYKITPTGVGSNDRFTELEGQITLSTYRYAASKADEVKGEASVAAPSPPAGAPK